MSQSLISVYISIHAPASGATFDPVKRFLTARNFNPRSREWSDRQCVTNAEIYTISIHAPASGATKKRNSSSSFLLISIHAPASGATEKPDIAVAFMNHFNPRSREWSDVMEVYRNRYVAEISIHAPASGATAFIDIFSFTVRLYFISSH